MRAKIKGIVTIIVVGFVLPILALMWLWKDTCQESVVDTLLLSAQQFPYIEVKEIDCGEKLKVATEINIVQKLSSQDHPSSDQALEIKREQIFLYQGRKSAKVRWQDSNLVEIAYHKDLPVVKRRPDLDGIHIEFQVTE